MHSAPKTPALPDPSPPKTLRPQASAAASKSASSRGVTSLSTTAPPSAAAAVGSYAPSPAMPSSSSASSFSGRLLAPTLDRLLLLVELASPDDGSRVLPGLSPPPRDPISCRPADDALVRNNGVADAKTSLMSSDRTAAQTARLKPLRRTSRATAPTTG